MNIDRTYIYLAIFLSVISGKFTTGYPSTYSAHPACTRVATQISMITAAKGTELYLNIKTKYTYIYKSIDIFHVPIP